MHSSLQNSGAKYVSNKMPKRFKNFSVCLGYTSAKKKKNCQRLPKTDTFVHYVGNGFSIPRYFAKDYYRLIFKKFVLPKLYCLHITGEMEPNISLVDHLVLVSFFVCCYYSRRKHYPTLEKTLCSEYSSV